MCGIGGIVRYGGGLEHEVPRLLRFRARLRHRGPDHEGLYLSAYAALVHTRLALSDPSGGAQPMTSSDGRFVVVYNGEIYNAEELRRTLDDTWVFRSKCDTEVLLAAYARWGAGCLPRLNGMFAFFVWDTHRHIGFAARDLLGVKPFVYTQTEDSWIFASEAKALLPERATRPSARLDALVEYLVVPCFSGVETPVFEDVSYLPPAHCMEISRQGVRVWCWGSYLTRGHHAPPSPERLQTALVQAVARTSAADATVGVFLSGGLDSTLVAALMPRTARSTRAFTIAFLDQDRYDYERSLIVTSDDGPFAKSAAQDLAMEQIIVPVDRSSIAEDLGSIAAHNDALPAWEQEIAQHHLARAAAAHCKAVMVGDAADETHFGYHFLLHAGVSHSPRGIIERFFSPILRRDVLDDPVGHFDAKYKRLTEAEGFGWDDASESVLATTWLIVHRWLPRLLHNGDIHTMAHSLEARVPFADTEVLALAREVSPALGLRHGIEKWLLRQAARGLVPESIRQRQKSALPKDQGVAELYQREASRMLDDMGPTLSSILDVERARSLCDPGRILQESERALLFRVTCLAHWVRHFNVRVP